MVLSRARDRPRDTRDVTVAILMQGPARIAQEAFRLESLAETFRDQVGREPTLEEHAETAGMVRHRQARPVSVASSSLVADLATPKTVCRP